MTRTVYIYEREGIRYSSFTWDSKRGKLLYTLEIVTTEIDGNANN